MRGFFALLLLALIELPSAEDLPLASPLSFRLEYASGRLAWRAGEASALTGGVQLWYEDIHLHGDQLTWTQSVIPGGKRPLVDRLELLPGAAGPEAGKVVIDSRACRLAGVGFRGLFSPAAVHLERRPIDPGQPMLVRWRAVLKDAGFFAGLLETTNGWVPHAGWAKEIELDLVADLVDDHLERLRFASIHLYGQTSPTAAERQRARIDRLFTPLDKPEHLADLPMKAAEFGMQSDSISIVFDDLGRLIRIEPERNSTMYGTPPADTPLGLRSRIAPER